MTMTIIPDLTLRSDLLMLISDLIHTEINTIFNTDTWFNTCWYLIYYSLTSTWSLTLISNLTLTMISDLKLRSDLLMLIYDLLHTDINMILNTDTWLNIEISFTHVYIWFYYKGINLIHNTDIWSDIEIWINTEI